MFETLVRPVPINQDRHRCVRARSSVPLQNLNCTSSSLSRMIWGLENDPGPILKTSNSPGLIGAERAHAAGGFGNRGLACI